MNINNWSTALIKEKGGAIIEVQLNEENMKMITNFFNLKDGIFIFSKEKQIKYFDKIRSLIR